MSDPVALARIRTDLATPLGRPGSGRQRYAAAMALYFGGEMSAEMLEAYRICSARDGDDVAVLLAQLGIPGGPRTCF